MEGWKLMQQTPRSTCHRCAHCGQPCVALVVDCTDDTAPIVSYVCSTCSYSGTLPAPPAPSAFRCPACSGRLVLSGSSFVRKDRYCMGTVCGRCNIGVRWFRRRCTHNDGLRSMHAKAQS
jgi:hypothetical protein